MVSGDIICTEKSVRSYTVCSGEKGGPEREEEEEDPNKLRYLGCHQVRFEIS